MTKLQTVILALVASVVAGALFKFVPDAKGVSAGVAALAVYLLGWATQHPADKPADSGGTFGGPGFVGLALVGAVSAVSLISSPAFADELPAASPAVVASSTGQVVNAKTLGNWEQALSIGATATMVNMQTGEVSAGAPLGACYGVTYVPFALGGDVCLYGELATKDHANRYIPSVLAHFQDVLWLGFGLLKEQGVGGVAPLVFLTGRIQILKL